MGKDVGEEKKATENGAVGNRDAALLGGEGAGGEVQAPSVQGLDGRVVDAADTVVKAEEVDGVKSIESVLCGGESEGCCGMFRGCQKQDAQRVAVHRGDGVASWRVVCMSEFRTVGVKGLRRNSSGWCG
jgi:hypothetical protein